MKFLHENKMQMRQLVAIFQVPTLKRWTADAQDNLDGELVEERITSLLDIDDRPNDAT